jgi:hypothetical protein
MLAREEEVNPAGIRRCVDMDLIYFTNKKIKLI